MKSHLLAGLVFGATLSVAHHSFIAEFDMNRPVRLEGTVTKLEFVNPHTQIYLEVQSPGGASTTWVIEAASPNGLLRRGFTKSCLPQGTRVVIDAFESRTTSHKAAGRDLVAPGGYTFLLGSFSEGVK